ncbi:MAG: class I adenylate-forming enzyme family protein, partial [Pseudomonadota bacterium]
MTPCPAPFNLAQYVLAKAQAQPDKIALALLGPAKAERWSYAKLEAAVRGVGRGLLEAGLSPGDQLLLRLGNGIDFPLAYLGAIAVGIVPVPTSSQLTPRELDAMLRVISPSAAVVEDGLSMPTATLKTIPARELSQMKDAPSAPYALGDPERLAYILFTSGTSGAPRAVAHAHRAIWARRMMFEGWYGLRAEDRLLHAGALNWSFTLGTGLLDPWTMGATALVPAQGTDLSALPLLLGRHDATLFAAAPGVLRRLLKVPEKLKLPKLRHTLTAGEHLQPALRAAWEEATGKGLYDAYGMTECSTFLSSNPAGAPSLTPQPGRQVTVLGDGTIAIHKDEQGLMLGYLEGGRPQLPLDGSWFLTADRGTMSADGTITYGGRSAEMLNAGGYRVSPQEIEGVLTAFPGVEEAAATEIPGRDGTIIAACYTAPAPLD